MSWPSDLSPQVYSSTFPPVISICKTRGRGLAASRPAGSRPAPTFSSSADPKGPHPGRGGLAVLGEGGFVLLGCEKFGEQNLPPTGKTPCGRRIPGRNTITPRLQHSPSPQFPPRGWDASLCELGPAWIPRRARAARRGPCALPPTRC